MSVLDDLKMIHDRDAQDALGVAEKQWQQLQYDYKVEISPFDNVQNVVLAGMGGSALAAQYIKSWPGVNVPFEVVRDYKLPSYVNENTLFIASSYSGNTEETLEALGQAEKQGAKIVVIAAGGKLGEIAEGKGYPFYQIPGGMQPRMAVFYNLAGLVQMLEGAGLISSGSVAELTEAANWLGEQSAPWRADTPTDSNPVKKLALDLIGSSPVIYASIQIFPVAYKWKINLNENSKNVAWCNAYPEFNHNEFLGWTSHPVEKPYKIVDLRSSFDHPQIKKRFEISDRLLSGKRPAAHTLELEGDTFLKQLLWGTVFGDFVSLYVALLNGLNPTPVDLIEKLKGELA